MNITPDVLIKAWWFDRISDLVVQNAQLATELAALREQAKSDIGLRPPGNGSGIDPGMARPMQGMPNG